MKVLIEVTRGLAETAIGQHILYGDGEKVNSSNFSKIISSYILMFGESSLDDHHVENDKSGVYIKAEEIVSKYYK